MNKIKLLNLSENQKKYLKLILKIIVSVVLITIIILNLDKESFINNFKLLNLNYVPLIFLFLFLNYLISSIRWKQLLIFENTDNISVSYLTGLYFIGSFFNNFMPTSIGGDVYKIFKLGKKIGNTTDAFTATFMERFTGVVVLVIISMFGLTKELGYLSIFMIPVIIIGFFVGIKLLKILGKKIKFFNKIYNSLMVYKDNPKVIIMAIVTSLIVQLLAIFTQYFVFLSIGIKLPIMYSLFIFPVVTLAGFFIPSLNGLGVQDTLYMKFFEVVGVTTSLSFSASVLYHLFRLGISLVGGVLYALGKDD